MKTIIAGSRNFNDYLYLKQQLDYYRKTNEITEVVSGLARGADELGEVYAQENDIPVAKFPADWNTYGKAAGPIRNRKMAEYADCLIAVWDGNSKGTKNMIEEMHKQNKPAYVIWIGAPITPQGNNNESSLYDFQ